MRITIEVSKKRFKEIEKGDEFIEQDIESVNVVCGPRSIIKPVVAVSVNRRKGTMLIQVEGKR